MQTTIGELYLLIERKVGEQPDGLKKNQVLKKLARLRVDTGVWLSLPVTLETERVVPSKKFWEEVKGPSAEKEGGATVPATKPTRKPSTRRRRKPKSTEV